MRLNRRKRIAGTKVVYAQSNVTSALKYSFHDYIPMRERTKMYVILYARACCKNISEIRIPGNLLCRGNHVERATIPA